MSRTPRSIAALLAVLVASAGSGLAADGPVASRAGPDHDALIRYARATWRSFEAMAGPIGLPADRLERDREGRWKPSLETSPTDIAAYLWSTLAARSLRLIDDAEADRRIGQTLATLGRLGRDRGFFFNDYDIATGSRSAVGDGNAHPIRPFLSLVDNGWLAASLGMVGNARPAFRDRAEALLRPMDFGLFYAPFDPADPVKHPGQFHGGLDADSGKFSAFYGMLNTEPRIVSYLAIARGQVPPEHYYRLFRTLPSDRGKQKQAPVGETRTYLGVPVFEGHYRVGSADVVPSWGGSMFEALMVPLFVPEEAWAPGSWGINHPLYVRAQIDQGLKVKKYGYWGFSPSTIPGGGYQTYGVEALGTEVGGYLSYEKAAGPKQSGSARAGRTRQGVVTPHASFLALRYAPRETLDNLRALEAHFPIFGEYGFLDSVDVATGAVGPDVLALDQGMILAAIANALADDAIRRAFVDGAIARTIRPLISPERFTAGEAAPDDPDRPR